MTPRERAEKIFPIDLLHPQVNEDLRIQVAFEIEEALKEQRDSDHMPDGACCIAMDRARGQGFFAAREKAAEEADNHNGCIDPECLKRGGQCGVVIAERIRQMEPEK